MWKHYPLNLNAILPSTAELTRDSYLPLFSTHIWKSMEIKFCSLRNFNQVMVMKFCSSLQWHHNGCNFAHHYSDIIMGALASQITSLTIVYSTVYSGADRKKHQSSSSLAFVRGIHRWLVNSMCKWPVMWKMFQFDDIIMWYDSSHGMFKTS